MEYFKINDNDYSMYVNRLKVAKTNNYKGMTNAAGNTLVKYINTKRIIEVGIIPLEADIMANLQKDIKQFEVTVSYLDPETKELVENIKCIIPQHSVEYYMIQANNVRFNACSLELKEL